MWDNYEECKQTNICDSFIYQYFEEKKEYEAAELWNNKIDIKLDSNSRADHYVNLTYASKAYEGQKISEEEMGAYLKGLKEKKRVKESAKINEAWKKWEESREKESLHSIIDELKYIFLCQTITEFFRNIGFVKRKSANSLRDSERDKRDDTLLDMYLQYVYTEGNVGRSISQGVFAGNLSDLDVAAMKEECEKFIEWANRQDDREIAIPIAFEKQTGAGLFILNDRILEGLEDEGHYCILRFNSIEQNFTFYNKKEVGSRIPFMQECTMIYRTDKLEAAIEYIQDGQDSNYYEGYHNFNEEYPIDVGIKPENSRFAKYFGKPEMEKIHVGKEERITTKQLMYGINQEEMLDNKKKNRLMNIWKK